MKNVFDFEKLLNKIKEIVFFLMNDCLIVFGGIIIKVIKRRNE